MTASDKLDTGSLFPDPEGLRRHLLEMWADSRQVKWREHMRRDPLNLAWLNPPAIDEPQLRNVVIVEVQIAVENSGAHDPDSIAADVVNELESMHSIGRYTTVDVTWTDARESQTFPSKLYTQGDAFGSDLNPDAPVRQAD